MEIQPGHSRYKWYILALATLTNALVVAAPSMAISVLFDEISHDLNLNLVQVGLVWGISSLPGIVMVLLGGVIGDRFGPKRVVLLSCLLVGITSVLRGMATDFGTLMVGMLLVGTVSSFITMNNLKNCGMWFPSEQLGLASGVLSMGMALGFMLGSILSATVLSPRLGGWRNVLYFYGVLAFLLCIPWLLARTAHRSARPTQVGAPRSILQNMAQIARMRSIWLYGLMIFGFGGCVQGMLGYLPLYLRGQGWSPASADGALAAFHTISMICVIPIAILSDRLRTRKKILLAAVTMTMVGVALLAVVRGPLVWPAVLLAGMVRDGFMAVFLTMIIETDGVGVVYAGTATGLVMVFSGVGNLIAPPVGNSLASLAPGFPFLFWAALTGVGFVGLLASRDSKLKQAMVVD